jgi:GTP-binding protein HflX
MKAQPFVVPRPPRQERAVLVGHAGGQRPKRSRGSRAGSAPGSRPGSGPGPLAGSVPRALDHAAVSTSAKDREHLDRSMDELALLADTAGATVASVLVQRRGTLHPATFLGKGKVAELKELAEMRDAELVIFDDDLSPAQVKNLEKALNRKVIDRSELILDIFARRARTRESRLQVELAQLEYTLPRLTGMWKHLERQAGGIGTRGPGETQLETDRRLVREKIARLKRELEGVERERETQRARRRREFRAAIVGYTNAGKSTLFNALTRAGVFVEDRLFATLDSTTRQLVSPERGVVLLTDTVGFIRKLPHHLVASFHSTLVEAIEADVLLHVTDASDPDFRRHLLAVDQVLDEILREPRPPRIMIFNKSDKLSDDDEALLRVEFPGAVVVSSTAGTGLAGLRAELFRRASVRAGHGRDPNDGPDSHARGA